MSSENPILNNPYEEPRYYYSTNDAGELDYNSILPGRRPFVPIVQTIPLPQGPQGSLLTIKEADPEYGTRLINLIRKEVASWREARYPNTTRITRELLNFWFLNDERADVQKLFFAQQEAIETAIWLNEAAPASNAGTTATTGCSATTWASAPAPTPSYRFPTACCGRCATASPGPISTIWIIRCSRKTSWRSATCPLNS